MDTGRGGCVRMVDELWCQRALQFLTLEINSTLVVASALGALHVLSCS